jgi:hypothetical protein
VRGIVWREARIAVEAFRREGSCPIFAQPLGSLRSTFRVPFLLGCEIRMRIISPQGTQFAGVTV